MPPGYTQPERIRKNTDDHFRHQRSRPLGRASAFHQQLAATGRVRDHPV